jgi:phosphate transport system substrate-binding protein
MSRFLFVYLNYKPGSQLDPLQREFVKYVFSREGQEVVAKDGFLPVTAKIAGDALKLVGIEK